MPPTIKADDFSDGLWIPAEAAPTTQQPGFAIPASGLLTADNVEFQPNGAVRGRRGSTKFNASARPGPITAVARFYTAPDLEARNSDAMLATANVNDNEGGTTWQNFPGCIGANDGSICNCYLIVVGESQNLVLYPRFDLGNPIPADATIQRIEVRIAHTVGFNGISFTGQVRDKSLTLRLGPLNAPTVTSADKALTGIDWLVESFEGQSYGLDSDPDPLWGTGWSAADINDPLFRVELRCESFDANVYARVDAIEMTVFFSSSVSKRLLVAHATGGNIVWETAAAGVFTTITSLDDPGRRPHTLQWPQKARLFIADGVNPLKVYNGVDIVDVFTDPEVGVTPKRGPYIALHKSRLYATEPTELHYSVYSSEVDDETKWDPRSHLNVNDERGGIITGLASFGDALIILKNTAIFRWVGSPETFGGELVEIDDRGCTSPDSVVVTPFGVIYLGREGLYLTDGQSVTEISRQIRPLFVGRDDETTFTDAVGVFFPRKQQYWLRLTQDATTGYVLQRLTIPTSDGETTKLAWSRIPIMPFNCGIAWTGAGDEGELYLGDSDGFVWLRDIGDEDDGTEITSTIRTRHQQLNENLDTGRINQIRLMYRGMQPVDVQFFYDQFETALVTTFSIGAIVFLEAAYQRIRYLITNYEEFGRFVSVELASTGGAAFEIQQLLLDLRMRSPKVWRL